MAKRKNSDRLLEHAIRKVLREHLDYSSADIDDVYDGIDPQDYSDAQYDEWVDDEDFLIDDDNDFDEMPFESKKRRNKHTLSEGKLVRIIREAIREKVGQFLSENYPLGAKNDPRAMYNQHDDNCETQTAYGKAYYYNYDSDEDKVVPFEVEIEVPGSYEQDWDGDDYRSAFTPYDDASIEMLVRKTGEIPEYLDGGFDLVEIEVEDCY